MTIIVKDLPLTNFTKTNSVYCANNIIIVGDVNILKSM